MSIDKERKEGRKELLEIDKNKDLILPLILIVIVFSSFLILSFMDTTNYNRTYKYQVDYFSETRTIDISIEKDLYLKYKNREEVSIEDPENIDILKNFTTNDTIVYDIATEIKENCHNKSDLEEVANALLSFVQDKDVEESIKYIEENGTDIIKYPIESLVEGGGDCEDLSVLYGSLLYALDIDFGYWLGTANITGGIYYHIIVGVNLSYKPNYENINSDYEYYMNVSNNLYYPAETTDYGWALGEKPDRLEIYNETYTIIK